MFNLCRLCLKSSSYHKHIYIGHSTDDKPTFEAINYAYDLEISEGDGLPEYICRECNSKLQEFVVYKKNAQKARSELVLLKWQLEKAHVKQEVEEITEEYNEDIGNEDTKYEEEEEEEDQSPHSPYGEAEVKSEMNSNEEDYVNLIVCKTEPIEEEEEEEAVEEYVEPTTNWSLGDHNTVIQRWPKIKEEVKSEPINEQLITQPPYHPPLPPTPITPSHPPNATPNQQQPKNATPNPPFQLEEGLGMKFQSEASVSARKSIEVWHINKNNKTNPSASFPSANLPGKYMYPCTVCYKEFTSEHYLQKHYLTHRKDKTHRCSLCGEIFKQVSELRKHRNVHRDRKEMICVHCGKKFYIKSMLVVHMRAHTGYKPFKCERCGKGFAQNGNLQSHYLVHMRRDRCACEVCGRSFLHQKHLKTHMALHSGIKPHSCELCGKSFAQPSVLKAHVAKHGGKKRFHCVTCGKAFLKMADKQRHEVVHGK